MLAELKASGEVQGVSITSKEPFITIYRCRLCNERFEVGPDPYPDDKVRRHKCSNGNFGWADPLGYMELFEVTSRIWDIGSDIGGGCL